MEGNLETIIIDDDRIATEQLLAEINKYKQLGFAGNAYSGSEGRALILNSHPDLIFLDVEMPDCTGFEFLRSIKGLLKPQCHVIFYTAYNKYMIDALREKAFDFLLKPLDAQEVLKVISRVLAEFPQEVAENKDRNETMILNTVLGELVVAKPDEISFFTYDEARRCWTAFLVTGSSYVLRRSTKSDKILAYSDSFMQVEKAHIINKNHLASISKGFCIMQPPFDQVDNIAISNSKLIELRNSFPNL